MWPTLARSWLRLTGYAMRSNGKACEQMPNKATKCEAMRQNTTRYNVKQCRNVFGNTPNPGFATDFGGILLRTRDSGQFGVFRRKTPSGRRTTVQSNDAWGPSRDHHTGSRVIQVVRSRNARQRKGNASSFLIAPLIHPRSRLTLRTIPRLPQVFVRRLLLGKPLGG